MKKNSCFAVAVATATFFFSGIAQAQLTAANTRKMATPPAASPSKPTPSTDAAAMANLKTINEKMFKHFSRNYQDASNIQVRNVKNEVRINYSLDGLSSSSQYDAKGRWLFTITHFDESKLDDYTRKVVESAYPGFLVGGTVVDIKIPGHSAKLVMIENKKEWKRIRIAENGLSIYEEYRKQ